MAETHALATRRLDRSGTLKRAALFACGLALVLLALAFVFHETLERSVAQAILRSATGLQVTVDGVHGGTGALVLSGVHAHSESGDVTLDASRVELARRDGTLEMEVDTPSASVVASTLAALSEPPRAFARRWGFGEGLTLRIVDGSVALSGNAAAAWRLSFTNIEGTLHHGRAGLAYDLTATLRSGREAFPLAGHASVESATLVHRWRAAALPLAAFGELLPQSNVVLLGGQLRDFQLSYSPPRDVLTDPVLHVRTRLEGGSATVRGNERHDVRGLHGELVFAGDGLGSPHLEGQVDGTPLDIAGEVHGLRGDGAWLRTGNRDLRQLTRLLGDVADRSALTSVRLETTAPGVAFAQYGTTTENGPLAVQLLAIDPHEPTLRFDTVIAADHVVSGGERTSAMGVRSGAVAGVNGDYFDIGRTYQPQGLLIQGGRLLRGPTDRMALIVHRDRSVTFSEFRMRGHVRTMHGDFPVTQLNNWPAGDVTVITSAFGKELPAASGVSFATLTPLDSSGHRYRVAGVTPVSAPIPVAFGLAFGPLTNARLHPGETIDVRFALDPPVEDALAGIGGGPMLLRDGDWYEDPHAPAPDERDVRWPVIGLGRLADDSLLLAAVDGRHPERSVGMTRPEFADLLRDFHVVDAMALDSGGSVTMVSRAPGDATVTVRNVPSDSSSERWVSDGFFIYSSAPAPSLVPPRVAPTPVPEARPSP